MALTVLSLCSGSGALELGLSLVVPTRVLAFVERESFAAAVLLARMENEALAPAPIWCGDLAELDPTPFIGVDLVTAGFSCQPFSSSGLRQGTDDERWIWPAIAGLVRAVGPRFVFLENVPGLLVPAAGQLAGIAHVLRDLASLGFDAEWCVLGAADVEAPHLRRRVFILAYRHGARLNLVGREPGDDRHPRDHTDGQGRQVVAHTRRRPDRAAIDDGAFRSQDTSRPAGVVGRSGGTALADSDGRRRGQRADPAQPPPSGRAERVASGGGIDVADALRAGGPEIAGGALGDEGADEGRPPVDGHQPHGGDEALVDPDSTGRGARGGEQGQGWRVEPAHAERDVADPDSPRREIGTEPAGAQVPDTGGAGDVVAHPDSRERDGLHERVKPRHLAADAGGCRSGEAGGTPLRPPRPGDMGHTRSERAGEPPAHPPTLGGRGLREGAGSRSLWPPRPDDHEGWIAFLADHPGLEPSLCGKSHELAPGMVGPLAYRLDRLRLLGNGVVPACVAASFVLLARRAGLT